ncbi:MAG: cupredoxin domain-containing protein [Candidatus Paceibacterota bacterium]|jgi:uncharacterized cupredoxin-like copper-binding protein
MNTTLRVIVTLFFIALIVLGVVFFSIFALVPKEKLARIKTGNITATSTQVQETSKSIFDLPFFSQFRELLSSRQAPEVVPTSTPEVVIQKPQELIPPGSPDKPSQSSAVQKEQLPQGTIEVRISPDGFSPKSFSVKAGEMVSLALVSDDAFTHTLSFDSTELSQFSMGVAAQETRVIFFWAPQEKGTYGFRCGLPGHFDRGEVGSMIVK